MNKLSLRRVWIGTALSMVLSGCVLQVSVQPTSLPTTLPTQGACAAPSGELVFDDPNNSYCFVYPLGYGLLEAEVPGMVVIASQPLTEGGEPIRATLNIQTLDPAGRTLAQIVDEAVATYPNSSIQRSDIVLGGEPAVLLDGVPGQDLNRQVYALYNTQLYLLTFAPFGNTQGETAAVLYEAVIGSWQWK